jgi:hypothetical protein
MWEARVRGATKKALTGLWPPEELNRLKPLWNKASLKEKQVILTLRVAELARRKQKEQS